MWVSLVTWLGYLNDITVWFFIEIIMESEQSRATYLSQKKKKKKGNFSHRKVLKTAQ